MQMDIGYTIRSATPSDAEPIVRLTIREAFESQGTMADSAAVERGVAASFCASPRSRYWIAEDPDGILVASTSIVTEWSDFHGADYWWIQSFYISPDCRGRGLADRLIDHLAKEARAAHALELRLYVHKSNAQAVRAYQRCGFSFSPYAMMNMAIKQE